MRLWIAMVTTTLLIAGHAIITGHPAPLNHEHLLSHLNTLLPR